MTDDDTPPTDSLQHDGDERYVLEQAAPIRWFYEDERTRYAAKRARYLQCITDLREPLTECLAWSELGFSQSGIAKRCGVTENTVARWCDELADKYGDRVLEARPQFNPVEAVR